MLKNFMASIGVVEKASNDCVSSCRYPSVICLLLKKDAQVLICSDGVKHTGKCC